jgi:oxygen-independent coproporphyrinogen-3 oxidase
MCQFNLNKYEFENKFESKFDTYFSVLKSDVNLLQSQNLIIETETTITVTELGKLFVRNVCMVFDAYLKTGHREFSKTI